MSDPMNRQAETAPQESLPSKSASPLLWLLVLIAVFALGWYFYNRHATEIVPPPEMPATSTTTSAPEATEDKTTASGRTARNANRAKPARAPGIDRAPEPIARMQPDYPPLAFRSHEEGTVLVRVDVDANGVPTEVDVATRSGSRELDRAAVDAVRKWRFKPAMKDGRAIASTVEVPIEFKLAQQ